MLEQDRKVLIVVPNVGLVNQMYSDFEDYSSNSEWNVSEYCHKVTAGKDKLSDKRVVISTWQSIYKLATDYFEQHDAVIVDEVHTAKAQCLTGILDKCINADYRLGLTGTLDGESVNEMTIQGLFGPAKKYITTKQLMDKGQVAKLEIQAHQLIYNDTEKKFCSNKSYKEEIDFILGHEMRNQYLKELVQSQTQPTLVLFNRIEHGYQLRELIEQDTGVPVFYIDGSTSGDMRENIRNMMEEHDNCILISSYGTSSTGMSIKNIHNIVFAAPYKSKIKVLQSIGRGLRMRSDKSSIVLFDIFDNLVWKKRQNYSLLHFLERYKIYMKEQFCVGQFNLELD